MKLTATAIAHPNIALAKYWGKRAGLVTHEADSRRAPEGRAGDGNVPAVPSLSVTLAGMTTTTTVTFDDALAEDELVLNGAPVESAARPHVRAVALLDRVRSAARATARARIVSTNDFPTASGLASSASGFAALALAASRAVGLDLAPAAVADLARQSSASAARSVFGGYAELEGGEGATGVARQIAPANAFDLRLVVCVTTEAAKSTSSTEGMALTQATSPYYAAWVADAPRVHREMRAALLASDFVRVGELAEHSALAMHACAMAAGVVYVNGATLAALAEVRAMRAAGIAAYGTIDAGPHLKCIVRAADVDVARERLARVAGVIRTIEAAPGDGARITTTTPVPRAPSASEEARP